MQNFKRGDIVQNIYTGKIYTVKKDGYWQAYAGGNTSDFTVEFEPTEDQKTPWDKASNLRLFKAEAAPKPMHTPLPWHVGMKPGPIIYGPKGEAVADCKLETNFEEENKYNAAFIVQAVNAHEVLVDAAQTALYFFENLKAYPETARIVPILKAALAGVK